MKRRAFITLLGGAAAWPLAAHAQQARRRIAVFMPGVADDPEYAARNAVFLQGLAELGWIVGRNTRIDYRWGAGDVDRYRTIASELVALTPDVIVALGYAIVSALQKATRSVPIVFTNVIDPVGGGLVESLARPGGNTTGFASPEFGFAGKWLELLKEIAPQVTRVAVLRDAAIASQVALFGSIQSVAPSLGVEPRPIDSHDAGEIPARPHCIRPPAEWRFDRYARGGRAHASRADRPDCRAAPLARNLFHPQPCRERRPGLLRY